MAKNISTLLIKLAFKSDPSVTGKIDAVMNSISSKMTSLARGIAGTMKSILGGIARTVASIFAGITRQIQSVAGQALDASMKYGVKRAEFSALFQDSGQEGTLSNDFLKRIDEFSEKTSHTTANLQKWASMLKAMGMPAEHILKWLDMMGRVAGGNADVNNRMLMNIGQVFANKRAFGLDIKQFGFAGIPIKEYLAQVHSTTVARIGEMVTSGEIGYEELFNAFVKMTEVGGAYELRMENYMKTVQGKRDILSKKYERLLRDSGKPLERMFGHYLGKGIEFLNAMKENGALTRFFQTLGDIIHIFAMTLTDVFGGSQDQAFTTMDAIGVFAKEMALKIQMLVYLFAGIPDRYRKLGLTDAFIRKQLGMHKVKQWFIDFGTEVYNFFTSEEMKQRYEKAGGFLIKNLIYGMVMGIAKLIAQIPSLLMGGALTAMRVPTKLSASLSSWVPGLSKLTGAISDLTTSLAKKNFYSNLVVVQQDAIHEGVHKSFMNDSYNSKVQSEEKAQEEVQRKNTEAQDAFGDYMGSKKAGNNLSVNIYTDESRSVVAEQVQQMYGELA